MKYYSIWLALICIFVFILQFAIPSLTEALVLNQQALKGEIWRFITAIFLHGSLQHLVFNMFALVLFGLILEKLIGGLRFLFIFLVSGILANIISVFFYPSSLGASGAIFGVIGTLTIIKPLMTVFAFSLPMPLFLATIFWAIADILGIFYPEGIGNLAHLSGLVLGLIFGIYLGMKHFRKEKLRADYARINIPEDYIRDWENRFMR